MSDSSVDRLFRDLDYPGRRKPVNRDVKQHTPEVQVWDAHPTEGVINGVKHEFFPIAALAKALGYSQQSIRLWETQGFLPRTPYRDKKRNVKPGATHPTKSRRLWTRAQIEAILTAAKKHKVILNRKPPTRSFARDVGLAFVELQSEIDTFKEHR